MEIPFNYPDKSVLLEVLWVDVPMNNALLAHGAEGQEVRWVHYSKLADFQFPEANGPILDAVTAKLSELS